MLTISSNSCYRTVHKYTNNLLFSLMRVRAFLSCRDLFCLEEEEQETRQF